MITIYQAEVMVRQVFEERLRNAELWRMCSSALRRTRVRSSLRRAIEEGLRCGIDPTEVKREFNTTLHQVTNR